MSSTDKTCWTLIHGAAGGESAAQEEFARRYLPVVEAYLAARWRGGRLVQERDDAAQEVFVECFRSRGALDRVSRDRPGGFRAFLYGVVRNVARRVEDRKLGARERQAATHWEADGVVTDDESLSAVFDRAWALALLREAFDLLAERVASSTGLATRRVELLRLRFEEDLPIREIAARWEVTADVLHEQYRLARRDFKRALLDVVRFQLPESETAAEKECVRLLSLIG